MPQNLRILQENEKETIIAFFIKENEKCNYVKTRRVTMKEEIELEARQKVMDQQKADALKEAENSAEAERET